MKTNLTRKLRGAVLCLVLLATAAPFAATAQTGAKPAQSGEGTIRLSGVIDGRDRFIFRGDTVEFRHEAFEEPTGISINGKAWDDLKKPFELGFTPDFKKASIVEKQGRNRVELTPGTDSFSLVIDDMDSSIGVYHVTIDTTGKAPKTATPEGAPKTAATTALEREQQTRAELAALIESLEKSPEVSEAQLETLRQRMARADREIESMQRQAQRNSDTARLGASSDNDPASTPSITTSPDENGEISITIDGNIRENGHFIFQGNTISYEPREDFVKVSAMSVNVNGTPWSLLKGKCTLDITPDFEKAAIVEKQGQKTVMLIPGKDRIDLYVGCYQSLDMKCHVKIALKNQIERTNARSAWIATSLPEPTETSDEPKELDIVLSGSFCDRDAFTFEGNTVRYRNEDGQEATDVRINYLPWLDLSKPFELDFTPDFDKVSLIPRQEMQERTTMTLEATPDKFELVLDHAIKDKPYYKFVHLAVKDQVDRRIVRSVRGSAPVQMPIVNGGFGPQPIPNFMFPGMDPNNMPKSGRPAFEESNNGAPAATPGAFNPFTGFSLGVTIDGPTDGLMHPDTPVTRPVFPRHAIDVAVVNVHGTVDRKAGFRLDHGSLIYQNYETDPDRAAPEDPVVLFNGKFASGVTLTDTRRKEKVWTNLSLPTGYSTSSGGGPGSPAQIVDTSRNTHLIFNGDDCDCVYFEHDGVIEIIVTNKTEQPAKFEFILWNGGDKVFGDDNAQRSPFPSFTGGGRTSPSGPSLAPPPPQLAPAPPDAAPKIRDISLTVEGKLDPKDAFVFEGNTVRFRPAGDRYPDKLSVNAGMQWPVTDKPFELYLAPDFSREVTVQGPAGSFTKQPTADDSFEITLGEIVSSDTVPAMFWFNLKFAVLRDNIPRSPDAVNPPAPVIPPNVLKQMTDEEALAEARNAVLAGVRRIEEELKALRANDVFITFEATIDKPATIHFEGNTVEYQCNIMFETDKPVDATINGKPWKDVSVPFELDFTPDYSHSYIKEKEGRGPVFSTKNYDGQYEVFLNDYEAGESKYRFTIGVGPHAPEKPAPKPVNAAQTEIENAASAAAGLPPGKFPTIMNGPMVISSIKEPTDGMDHPDYTVTKPAPAPVFRPERKIVVRGTVAMNAGFRLQGNRLYYLNYQSRESGASGVNPIMYDGKFASGVTVNGKPWTNLTRPFELDVSLTPSTGKYLGLKGEHCQFDYQFHHDLFEIGIRNSKREPAPFELTLWLTDPAS